MWASVVVACGLNSCGSQSLEHRLNSCGAQAYLLHCICDRPGSGIKPVSLTSASGFFNPEPSGKPPHPTPCNYLFIHMSGRRRQAIWKGFCNTRIIPVMLFLITSVKFDFVCVLSHSVMSDSLRPRGL